MDVVFGKLLKSVLFENFGRYLNLFKKFLYKNICFMEINFYLF